MNSGLSNRIKAEAMRLGFSVCGISRAEAVDKDEAKRFTSWLGIGGNATMAYMENHLEKRLDPRLLVPGTRSIVSVALNYAPAKRLPKGEYQIAAYALGQDYHDIVKGKLRELASNIFGERANEEGKEIRVFSDSAPVLERYWAVKAGIGWIGRNHQLIVPRAGSMFFLGEMFVPVELEYDSPMETRCGKCRRCIDACPTGALAINAGNSMQSIFLSSKCLSYQTIENRGDIPDDMAAAMGDTIYGCDRCQQACPWNKYASPTEEPLLQPKEELMEMTREQWQALSEEDYRRLFKGSAVKRAKYEGLMRNINSVRQSMDRKQNGNMNREEEITNVVNEFFHEFTWGITAKETGKTPEMIEPKMLKRVMLEHYEEIADAFHHAAYPRIAAINGIEVPGIPETITPDMMRSACASEELFNAMVEAYRRNFISLLKGIAL